MLLSAAKTALKAYGFDDTDPLSTWLEAAKQEVEAETTWPWLRKVTTLAATANLIGLVTGGGVPLPSDFSGKVYSLRNMTDGTKLKYVDPVAWDRDIENQSQTGVPALYTVQYTGVGAAPQWAIYWWPIYTVAWSVKLTYLATLTDMALIADASQMPGPSEVHMLYVFRAAAIALMTDNEEERAQTAQQQFESGLAKMRKKFKTKLDEPDTVQDVMGYA